MPLTNLTRTIESLGPESEWLQEALRSHAYINIERLSARLTERESELPVPPVDQLGPLAKLAMDRMSELIRGMSVEIDGNRGGDYLVYVVELIREIKSYDSTAQLRFAAPLAYLSSLIEDPSTDLARSKDRVIEIYKQFIIKRRFYGDLQYEGREIASHLGIDLSVEVHTPTSVYRRVVFESTGPKVVLYQSQAGEESGRSQHFILHSVDGHPIAHSIPGDGNCLFAALAQAVIEIHLLGHRLHTPELEAARRSSQTTFGIQWGMIAPVKSLAAPVARLPVESTFVPETTISHESRMAADLAVLIKLRQQLDECISADEILPSKLKPVGQLCRDIAWCEDDKKCVRNKHGFRNRHKEEENKLNNAGAKLNFEALGHLIDYPDSSEYIALWQTQADAIKASLQIFRAKVNFILTAEYAYLTAEQRLEVADIIVVSKQANSHDEELGWLLVLACFAFDIQSIDRILGWLNDFDRHQYSIADLSDRINRYKLGYLFSLIGETAKEISEFIKPDTHEDSAKNKSRYFFGRLGKYRQELKDFPQIVQLNHRHQLNNMRDRMADARPSIVEGLSTLRQRLLTALGNRNLTDYQSTALARQFEEAYPNMEHDGSLLTIGITQIHKRVGELAAQLTQSKQKLQALYDQKIELELAIAAAGVNLDSGAASSSDITKIAFESNTAKRLINLCKCYSDELLETSNSFTVAQKNLIRFLREIFYQLNPKTPPLPAPKKTDQLQKELPKYQKELDLCLSSHAIPVSDDMDYVAVLTPYKPAVDLLSPQLETVEEQIKRRARLDKELEEEHKRYAPYAARYPVSAKSGSAHPPLPDFDRLVLSASEETEFLFNIHSKLSTMIEHGDVAAFNDLLLAEKTCFGILGQLFKTISSKKHRAEFSVFLFNHSIFSSDLQRAISVRHKHVSHDMLHCNDELVRSTIINQVNPWRHTFAHMRVVVADKRDAAGIQTLRPVDYRLQLDVETLKPTDKLLYGSYVRLRAFNEFMLTEKAIHEYNGLDLSADIHPELAIELHWQASLAFRNSNDFQAVSYVLLKAMRIVDLITDEPTRQMYQFRLRCDLGIALTQLDHYQEAMHYFNLAVNQPVPDYLLIHRAAAQVLLCSVYAVLGHTQLALAKMELLFIDHFEHLAAAYPVLVISMLGQMISIYFDRLDFVSARDFKLLLDSTYAKTRAHLVERMGQALQYNDLAFACQGIKYDMLMAILQADEDEQRTSLQKVHHRLITGDEKLKSSSFAYLAAQKNDRQELIRSGILTMDEATLVSNLPAGIEALEAEVAVEINQAEIAIKDMRAAVAEFIIKTMRNPALIGDGSFVDAHRQELIKDAQHAVKHFYLAAVVAWQTNQRPLAVDLMRKSLLCTGMSGFVREEFARKQHVDPSLSWLVDWVELNTFDESALKDYLRGYLSGTAIESSHWFNQSLCSRYQQAVDNPMLLAKLREEKQYRVARAEERMAEDTGSSSSESEDSDDEADNSDILVRINQHMASSLARFVADPSLRPAAAGLAHQLASVQRGVAAMLMGHSSTGMSGAKKPMATTATCFARATASAEERLKAKLAQLDREGKIQWRPKPKTSYKYKKPQDGKMLLYSDISVIEQAKEVCRHLRSHNKASQAREWQSLIEEYELSLSMSPD